MSCDEEQEYSMDYYLGVLDASRHAANIVFYLAREKSGKDGAELARKVICHLQELENNALFHRGLRFANHMGVKLDGSSTFWDFEQRQRREKAVETIKVED
jgi:hypothetical protein